MELVYSPKAGAIEKKYKHYTVNSCAKKELIADKKKEFFYIGKDVFVIDNLVRRGRIVIEAAAGLGKRIDTCDCQSHRVEL